MFFHLPNLSSSVVKDSPPPWDSTSKRPQLKDKADFRHWVIQDSTDHYFFSGFEGLNQSARINLKDNPPYRMHGLVADYDSATTREAVVAYLDKNSPVAFRPAWISATFSQGVRLVWEFEKPIFCHNTSSLKALLTRMRIELKCAKLSAGLDDIILKPDQYYELGTNWQRYSDVRIPTKILHLWVYESGQRVKWASEGADIPMELVAAEVEKQFPGKWPNDFVDGARGPRFWDPTADNDTAAIVRSAGMQCFTGPLPFLPWGAVLGAEFTREFEANQVAAATQDIYYDNMHYWRKGQTGNWFYCNQEVLSLHLRVKAGLSREMVKSTSEVDHAIYHIQTFNQVVQAIPFVHQSSGLHRLPDGLFLNVSNVAVCQPSEGTQSWGEDFPWIASYLKGFFSTPDQEDFFFAWLQRFYKSALEKHMEQGHAIFIAGKVDQGKTLLGTKVIAAMLGGAVDATRYILDETSWNSSLFERAVWNIDDPKPGKDPRTHGVYSANIKKHVANQGFDFQKKFKDSARVEWKGRLIITLNDDEISLGMLPEVDISIMDKVMFFRTADRQFDFTDADSHITKELPFFCRWLLDWVPPEHTKGRARYGLKAYHEPSLLNAAHERGRAHEFQELLEIFLLHWFRAEGAHAESLDWTGSATQLYLQMSAIEILKPLTQKTHAGSVGKGLNALLTSGNPHITMEPGRSKKKTWILKREMVCGLADELPGNP